MFEEPTRLITHLISKTSRSMSCCTAMRTFVNETLARFYGGGIEKHSSSSARRKRIGTASRACGASAAADCSACR